MSTSLDPATLLTEQSRPAFGVKRKKAGWDHDSLLKSLAVQMRLPCSPPETLLMKISQCCIIDSEVTVRLDNKCKRRSVR